MSAGVAVQVRALGSRGGRNSVHNLGNSDKLLLPDNLADDAAVGDVLSAVGLGSLRGGSNGRRRGSGSRLRGGRGRGSRAALLALLLEDVTGKRRGLVGGQVASLVSQAGDGARVLTILDGDLDVTREDVGGTLDVVAEEELRDALLSLDLARGSLTLANNVEQRAVLNAARGVGASLNSLLQEFLIPTHPEVTVESETGGITVSHDEATVASLEGSGVVDNLEEHAGETDRELGRAVAVHDKVGESDVVAVVLAVKVLTIPARGEHEFQTETVGTVGIKVLLAGHVVAVQSTFGGLLVVQAVEADGALREVGLAGLAHARPERLGRVLGADVAKGV